MSIQLRGYQQQAVGKVEDLKLVDNSGKGLWAVFSNGRQLTNVLFQ